MTSKRPSIHSLLGRFHFVENCTDLTKCIKSDKF
nr:MAG TPA: hypothetical protein [Caudoviricetes sp.]